MNDGRRCTARNRQGERCGRPAAPGASVCHMHGGAAPQVKKRARLRLMEVKTRSLLERLDEPDPWVTRSMSCSPLAFVDFLYALTRAEDGAEVEITLLWRARQ